MSISKPNFRRRIGVIISRTAPLLTLVGLFGLSGILPAKPAQAAAGINTTINFQGRLLNAAGAVVADGNYNMQFKIYKDGPGNVAGDTGGTLQWTEEWLNQAGNGVTVKNGYFSVNLGTITTLVGVDLNQQTLWLSTNIAASPNTTSVTCTPFSTCVGDGEMLPMRRMASAVYAFNAGQLGGLSASGFIQNTTSPQTANIDILSGAATTVPAAQIQTVASATAPVLLLKGGATPGTGADLLQLQSSTAAVLFRVDSAGVIGSADVSVAATNSAGTTLRTGNSTSSGNTGDLTITSGIATSGNSGNILIDTGGASGTKGSVNIGTTNAAAINLNQNTTVAANKSLTAGGSATFQDATNAVNAFSIYNQSASQALAVDTTADASNLVTNGDFEANTTGWSAKGGATLSQTTAQQLYAADSLQVAAAASGDGAKYPLTLSAGQQYTLTFYGRTDSTTATFAYGYAFDGANEATYANTAQSISSTRWQRYSITFTPASISGTPYVFLKQTAGTARNIYIDGVTLATGPNPLPFREGRLSLNSTVSSQLTVKPINDIVQAFQVIASDNSQVFTVDTSNNRVGIGGSPSTDRLYVTSGTSGAVMINQTSTFNILDGQQNGTNVFTVASTGATLIQPSADGAAILQVKTNGGSNAFSVDTTGGTVAAAVGGTLGVTGAATFSGNVTIQTATNSTTAFQVQNASAANVLTVDTTNSKIGIGISVPLNTLSVSPLDYQTGTVTRTNASATLVGTGTTWTAAMIGDTIVFADGTTNTISAFTDATHITMFSTAAITDGSPVTYRFHRVGLQVTSTGTVLIGGIAPVQPSQLFIKSTDSTQRAFTVQAAAGQAADLLDFYNSSSLFMGGFDASANLFTNGSVNSSSGRVRSISNSTSAFQVQNSATNQVLTVDTSGNVVVLGMASTLTGQLSFANSGGANLVTLQAGASSAAYALTLPTVAPTTGQCLQSGSVTAGLLQFATCGLGSANTALSNLASVAINTSLLPGVTNSIDLGSAALTVRTGYFGTSVITPVIDTASAVALNVGTTASVIDLNKNVVVAAGQYLNLIGSGTRPGSPTDGMLYYDTTQHQLIQYSSSLTKWVGDRNSYTKIVAANNSTQAEKDAADYVATGAGDQAQINSALTAAAGGTVYLMEGTYNTTASINVPNSTILSGAGTGTIIIPGNVANTITNSDTVNGTNVTIQNLSINGNNNFSAGTQYGIYFNSMGATSRPGGSIRNVVITQFNTGSGIYLNTSVNNSITGDSVTGIYCGCGFYSNDGILLAASSKNLISGNFFQANSLAGISLTSSSTHNTITGNSVYDNGDASSSNNNGITLSASSANSITSNEITDSICTVTCYAINISDSTSISNYLADNHHSGTAANVSTINDVGTDTIYANQPDGNGNLINRGTGAFSVNTSTATTSLTLQGALSTAQLPTPATPVITKTGAAGGATWGYKVTAYDGLGETLASAQGTIATGVSPLTGSNFTTITWVQVPGAISYKIYRTFSGGTPATTGLIGTVTGGIITSFNDTGIAGTTAIPGANTTGGGSFAGLLQGTLGLTISGGAANINASGTAATNIGNTTGALTVLSGGTSSWANTSGGLTISTVTSGTLAVTSAGALNLSGAAASSLSTSAGALTLTAAAASTWSTTTGNLTLQAGGANSVILKPGTDSATAISLQNAGGIALLNVNTSANIVNVNADLSIGKKADSGGTTADWALVSGAAGTPCSAGATAVDAIKSSVVYNGSLYIGTNEQDKAEVCRYDGGTTYTRMNSAAGTFGAATSTDTVGAMTVFNGYLYIGTTGGGTVGADTNKASVYRWDGSTTFTLINTTQGTFDTTTTAIDAVTSMVVHQGMLIIGTSEPAKAQVYEYEGGAPAAADFVARNPTAGQWTTSPALRASYDTVSSMVSYNNQLYIGANKLNAAEIFRWLGSYDSVAGWAGVNSPGQVSSEPSATTDEITAMTVYNGNLWASDAETGTGGGARVVQYSSDVNDSDGSFSDLTGTAGTIGATTSIDKVTAMTVYNGSLYLGTSKASAGEVYRYDGGEYSHTVFTKISQATAGTIKSGGTASITAIGTMTAFNNLLFVGTNFANNAESYTFSSVKSLSQSLIFNAASTAAGSTEQASYPNQGSIYFDATQNATSNLQGATGSFIFSAGINTNSGAYDVAEDYPTRDDTLKAGDLVSIDPHETGFVRKASGPYDPGLVGVYSEKPALRLTQSDATINGGRAVPVALAGRVPVTVSTANGPILPGDPLTSSDVPGVAMKATGSGRIVGMSMESFSGTGTGTVTTFVNPNYYSGLASLQGNTQAGGLVTDGKLAATDLAVSGTATVKTLNVTGDVAVGGILTLGSASADTAGCTNLSGNGAMYYNSNSNTIRSCEAGSWTDNVTVKDLGLLTYGVMPDSGNGSGDLTGVGGATTGPCKVTWASTTSVDVSACTAYSGGRKLNISAAKIANLNSANSWYHITLDPATGAAVASAAGASEAANQPIFSTAAPIVTIADVRTGSGSTIANIYDSRVFTTSTKTFATVNQASAVGWAMRQSSVAGQVQATSSQADANIRGVVVATTGTAATNSINVILVTAGPTPVKSVGISSVNSTVIPSATLGYVETGTNTATYGTLGIAQRSIDTTCSAASDCQFSQLLELNIR